MKPTLCLLLFAAMGIVAPAALHAAPTSTPTPPQALEILLSAGPQPLSAHPACEPFQGEATTRRPLTLADDLAATLFEMRDGPLSVQSRCESAAARTAACQVIFTLARGELNWSRIYQFQAVMPSAPGARPALRTLQCSVIP